MNKTQPDGHLKKNSSSKCELHPAQKPKYYCSDSKCRALLCVFCMKQHPKEHLSTLTTIENVKAQTLETLKNETLSSLGKYVEGIFKSSKVNDLFKEALGTLMQQNTTVDLDEEDVADILADTLQRKYFEMKFLMKEKVKEDATIESSSANLVAFDFEFDAYDDREESHEETARKFCQEPPGHYSRKELDLFYAESRGQSVFWSTLGQILVCREATNPVKKWKKYEIPLAFNSLTVMDSEKLFVVIVSDNKLVIYSVEDEQESEMSNIIETDATCDKEILEDYQPLKALKEVRQEEEILFFTSDHAKHLFVVTEGESGLTATIYELKSQDNQLELSKTFSFEPFDLPKKVVFDQVNKLLFILGDDFLETYKYPTALTTSLQVIFKIKAEPFHWHQATKRLLFVNSGKLYQLHKGEFKLVRVIKSLMKPIELTNQGILCEKNGGFYVISYKNPNHKRELVLPSMKREMGALQEVSFERFYQEGFDSEVDPKIGYLSVSCNSVKIAHETPDYLLIYANVTYDQNAAQKMFSCWEEFGGKIYSQRLIKYAFGPKKYEVVKTKK